MRLRYHYDWCYDNSAAVRRPPWTTAGVSAYPLMDGPPHTGRWEWRRMAQAGGMAPEQIILLAEEDGA